MSYFITRQIILLSILLAPIGCMAVTPVVPASSLVGHLKVLQQLKERFLNDTKKLKPVGRTPTTAYIEAAHAGKITCGWRDAKDVIKEYQKKYGKIIDMALAKEKEYCGSHYVFYHGQRSAFRILQDFLKELYAFIHIHCPMQEFEFFRIWYEAERTFDANMFIDREEQCEGTAHRWNDMQFRLMQCMLSVNLSLFGNITDSGSCSFAYFVGNSNLNPLALEPLLQKIFDYFGFNNTYIPKIVDLQKLMHTEEGNLLQIFIPKNKVDTYVYLSEILGTPFRQAIDRAAFNTTKKRHMKISPILDLYCKNPSAIQKFDRLQARLLLSQDCILNPDSGVKIFRYTTVPDQRMAEYKKELGAIMDKLIEEWLSARSQPNIQSTQLARLLKHLKYQ